MTMPHKICPQCGQPAVLEIAQCRRCGFVYAPMPAATPPAFTPSAREMPRDRQAAQQRKNSALPLALMAIFIIGVVAVGSVVRVLTRAAFSGRGVPGGSGVNSSPADTASPPGKLSFFVESDGKQEMPVLTFRNMENDTMTLTLQDSYGHVFKASSRSEQLATVQVPAGYYSVSLQNDNPMVRPNWGDATFRKFKTYHADFVEGHFDARIHLGE